MPDTWPISVSTLAFHGHPDELAYATLAELGVRLVEPAFIRNYRPELTEEYFDEQHGAALRGVLDGYGLDCLAISGHLDLGAPDAFTACRRRIEFCAGCRARYLITNAGRSERADAITGVIERLLPVAADAGVVVALENPGDPGPTVTDTAAIAAPFVRAFRSDWLRFNYDFSNVYSASRGTVTPEEDYPAALDIAVHYHCKDLAPAVNGIRRFTPIGAGITDYRAMLGVIAERQPNVPIGIELPLRFRRGSDFAIGRDPGAAPVPIDEIARAVRASEAYIRNALGRT